LADVTPTLLQLGWRPALAAALDTLGPTVPVPLVAGRVVRQDRGWLRVLTAEGPLLARLAGRMQHRATGAEELPAVGDWVAVEPSGERGTVHALLPRHSLLVRRQAGSEHAAQPIAANLDVAFLMTGLDGDFNVRRIERALALVRSSGAQAVVLLNKADMHPDVAAVRARVAEVAGDALVLAVSARTGEGLAELPRLLPAGNTGALLGSSGVGKSTLLNRLAGESRAEVGAVRAEDSRGRHTTTHRELHLLPGGGLLIDAPGMREFGLWDGADAVEDAFEDVQALAARCRFSDCVHAREPGCAVRAAVEDGTLDAERFAHWQKLTGERARLSRPGGSTSREPAGRGERSSAMAAKLPTRRRK
jgi:ribosome biogenesis GTPase